MVNPTLRDTLWPVVRKAVTDTQVKLKLDSEPKQDYLNDLTDRLTEGLIPVIQESNRKAVDQYVKDTQRS